MQTVIATGPVLLRRVVAAHIMWHHIVPIWNVLVNRVGSWLPSVKVLGQPQDPQPESSYGRFRRLRGNAMDQSLILPGEEMRETHFLRPWSVVPVLGFILRFVIPDAEVRITSKRLQVYTGIITRGVSEIPLGNITSVDYNNKIPWSAILVLALVIFWGLFSDLIVLLSPLVLGCIVVLLVFRPRSCVVYVSGRQPLVLRGRSDELSQLLPRIRIAAEESQRSSDTTSTQ